MKPKAQEEQEGSSRGLVWVCLCWLAAILVLYVLSSWPLLMMLERGIIGSKTTGGQAVDIIYRPVGWAYQKTLLHKPLGMYWHLWAPGLIVSNGNMKR